MRLGFAPVTSRQRRVTTVLPIGDSITLGASSTDGSGYRGPLFALAAADGKRIEFLGTLRQGPATVSGQAFPNAHSGYSGYKIADVAALTPAICANRPDVILLHIGINDVNDPPNMPTIQTRYQALLTDLVLRCPTALFVLAQNTTYQGIGPQPDFDAYVSAIPGIAAARLATGQRFRTCDMRALLVSELADTVHPNDAGYSHMAQIWYTVLRDVL